MSFKFLRVHGTVPQAPKVNREAALALAQTNRLRPDQRIRKQEIFKRLAEKGTFARGELFYVWADKQSEAGQSAYCARPILGIIVSRRTDARATRRNLLKRRIREIFRKHQHELKENSVFLVKAKESRKTTSFEAMEKDLVALFKKART